MTSVGILMSKDRRQNDRVVGAATTRAGNSIDFFSQVFLERSFRTSLYRAELQKKAMQVRACQPSIGDCIGGVSSRLPT
jgi:hypothetical protein